MLLGAVAEVPADVWRAHAGAEAPAKRSDDDDGRLSRLNEIHFAISALVAAITRKPLAQLAAVRH